VLVNNGSTPTEAAISSTTLTGLDFSANKTLWIKVVSEDEKTTVIYKITVTVTG
jgi:hypothetical protein